MKHLIIAAMTLLCSSSCGPEFDPYNELSGLRVLAVRAEPAELSESGAVRVDSLIYNDTDQSLERAWSLCPWTSDPNDGFKCPVDQESFDRAWKQAKLPGEPQALSLGDDSTLDLTFPGSLEKAQALCRALTVVVGESATTPPDCTTRWEWTVKLLVKAGGERVSTVKSIGLILDDEIEPNRNPKLLSLAVEDKQSIILSNGEDGETPLTSGAEHRLRVKIADDAAELYLPLPLPGQATPDATIEPLTFTWFVSRGSTERVRTTYGEGVESLEEASRNEWQAPKQPGPARLFVVLRDPRGGVDWLEGRVELVK